MATGAITPPPGFTLETNQTSTPSEITPPVGFTLENPTITPTKGASISPAPQKGIADTSADWLQALSNDLMTGSNETGVGHILHKIGVQPLESGVGEGAAEYMGSVPLGVLQGLKGEAELAGGHLGQGTKDYVAGPVKATTIPASFIAPDADPEAVENAAGQAVKAVAGKAKEAGQAVKSGVKSAKEPFSLQAIQDALAAKKAEIQQGLQTDITNTTNDWHKTFRGIMDSVAKKAGVNPSQSASLRDVAADVSAALRTKASNMYKQFDQALGGTRFQTFDTQIKNVERALSNSAGIDPDADGRLVERLNQLEDAKAKAVDELKGQGINVDLINQANANHRQAMALGDLSKKIQASTVGLRPELATGVEGAPEVLAPARLAKGANDLYNTGRLRQALGQDHADDLLRAIEGSKQKMLNVTAARGQEAEQAAKQAAEQEEKVKLRRYVVGGLLGGTTGGELIRHFLGEKTK